MVLYWSYRFSVRGSHSQGETITVHPFLGWQFRTKEKEFIIQLNFHEMEEQEEMSFVWNISSRTLFVHKDLWDIKWEIHYNYDFSSVSHWRISTCNSPMSRSPLCGISFVLTRKQNLYLVYHGSIFRGVSSTDCQKIWKCEEVILHKNDFSPIRDFPTCARCKLIGSHYNF